MAGIQLYHTPIRMDRATPLEVSVSGEVLTLDGVVFDLSTVGPTPQVVDSPWVMSPAFRLGGKVHVMVLAPYNIGETPVSADVMPAAIQPAQAPVARLIATALLTVTAGDLGSVSSAAGLSFGVYVDVGLYWLFFSEEAPDLRYSYAVATSHGRITVTDRQTSYMELTVTDDTGAGLDPAEISVQLYRSM